MRHRTSDAPRGGAPGPPRRPRSGERGGALGCLLWLLLLVGAGWVAVKLGTPYVQAWRFEDAMKTQAAAAENRTDAEIRASLAESAARLDIPLEAGDVQVRRGPETITISAEWTQDVELPEFRRTLTFHPEVRMLLLEE